MTWIGWNNSEKHSSGAGYGFKIDRAERDRNFKPKWQQITVELPTPRGINAVSVNVGKSSFWKNCPELISKDIGRWMLRQATLLGQSEDHPNSRLSLQG